MRKTHLAVAVLLALGPAGASSARADASVLSPPQQALIAKALASAGTAEKKAISAWSDTKKLAEFFCAPAGLEALKQKFLAADRLVLGPGPGPVAEALLVRVGNSRLSGAGTVRTGGDWRNLRFECTLDPEKATVTSFTYTMQ